LTTKTDVFAPSASTAHLVPRTAAIACGVTTSNLAAARLLRHFEQQGLVAEFDGIDMAVAVAIPELELRAAFGHDRDRRRPTQRFAFPCVCWACSKGPILPAAPAAGPARAGCPRDNRSDGY
jgi:hypothetical protein